MAAGIPCRLTRRQGPQDMVHTGHRATNEQLPCALYVREAWELVKEGCLVVKSLRHLCLHECVAADWGAEDHYSIRVPHLVSCASSLLFQILDVRRCCAALVPDPRFAKSDFDSRYLVQMSLQ